MKIGGRRAAIEGDPMTTETVRLLATYKSRSGGRRHKVVVSNRGGPPTCSCPGFTYRGKCWHVNRWTPELIAEKYR